MNTARTANGATNEDIPEPVKGDEGEKRRAKIALTGASGYIGHNLLKLLTGDYDVIALSRNGNQQEHSPHVEWRSCELFSVSSAEKALEGADYAVYLVHSMLPSAKLTQADFEDMDAILADNFARAARKNGIKQIVYLSGIIPEHLPQEQFSRHLRSRLEVERILGSYGVPVTTIRDSRIPFEEAARQALKAENEPGSKAKAKSQAAGHKHPGRTKKSVSDVRSIQRVVLPGNTNADWAARYYLEWLGKSLKALVRMDYDGGNIYRVHLRASRKPILELTYLPERSSAESTVYHISGGAFTKLGDTHEGRLEFLQIPGTRECVIALHDYLPSLPWFIYKYTQAKVHLWVMAAFRRHLQNQVIREHEDK